MAKELIKKNHRISIKEVAIMSGFYNDAALIRVFKKHEGITPGQFRNLL